MKPINYTTKTLLFIIVSFLFLQCNDNEDEESKTFDLIVASTRDIRNNIEETPSSRYVYYVKYKNADAWITFPYEIQNFNYEEGYEYLIKVKEVRHGKIAQDAPSLEYFFLELKSKERKSSNIPVD